MSSSMVSGLTIAIREPMLKSELLPASRNTLNNLYQNYEIYQLLSDYNNKNKLKNLTCNIETQI